ncbi:MAG: IS110 family transposase [Acidimicrobiales bacterium]
MTKMPERTRVVTGGVDTHAELHVAAVIDEVGRVLGTESFEASTRGYGRLLAWMRSFGELADVGVEGTGSYGAGLDRYLSAQGVQVVEVVRPNRQKRRRRGKSDPLDAEEAARAALNGEASGASKAKTGAVESLRALRVARRGAVKARTQAANSITALVVSAPEDLRCRLAGLSTDKRAALAARFRPGELTDPAEATKAALRSVARRYRQLDAEIAELDKAMEPLVVAAAPAAMLAKPGVGPRVATALLVTAGDNPERMRSEAGFAALCGASPVDASSGKQTRHRLNRGGDREANSALWRIVQTRMRFDPRTQDYVERRTKEGKTKAEIVRCLKRYVAREIYKTLVCAARPAGTGLARAA